MKKLLQLSLLSLAALLTTQKLNGQCLECLPGNNTVKLGYNNTISQLNYYQTTIGNFNTISGGVQNYAIGAYNTVSGTQSMSLGTYSEALAPVSFTLGHYLKSQNTAAFVIGLGNSPTEKLRNTIESSLVIGFNSAYPTLFVSRTEREMQSGRVGIGNVTDPQAKLHIRADGKEDASLLLESNIKDESETQFQRIQFASREKYIAEIVRESDRSYSILRINNLVEGVRSRTHFLSEMFIFEKGYIGIGTEEPQAMLDVAGEAMVDGLKLRGGYSLPASPGNQTQFLRGDGVWDVPAGGGVGSYWQQQNNTIYYDQGDVGIGTASTLGYKLAVAGKIIATEVMIKNLDNWYDDVFNDEYKLISLRDLEKFILENNHLPEIPSEVEVMNDGIQMGSIAGLLLKKIEELTLYTIQQQKLIEQQQQVLQQLIDAKDTIKVKE